MDAISYTAIYPILAIQACPHFQSKCESARSWLPSPSFNSCCSVSPLSICLVYILYHWLIGDFQVTSRNSHLTSFMRSLYLRKGPYSPTWVKSLPICTSITISGPHCVQLVSNNILVVTKAASKILGWHFLCSSPFPSLRDRTHTFSWPIDPSPVDCQRSMQFSKPYHT